MKISLDKLKSINQYAFIIISEIFVFLVLYKIFHVPIIHDEPASTVGYCWNYNAWQIMMYPDSWPNNHILNTLATKFLLTFLPTEQWIVRLPNLFSFLIYLYAIYRIINNTLGKTSVLYIPALLLFLANPFLLDFFGLCRGYGMSAALATLSISFAITAFLNKNNKHIWISMAVGILASYANFSLLDFWCVILFLSLIFHLQKTKGKEKRNSLILLLLLNLGYLSLIANPIIKIHQDNQLQYWDQLGFYKATLLDAVIHAFYSASYSSKALTQLVAYVIIGVSLLSCIYICYKFVKERFNIKSLASPLFVTTTILVGTALTNIIQNKLLGTPNLISRTAVFFYPLFISLVVVILGGLQKKLKRSYLLSIALVISFIVIYHNARVVKLTSVREWWYEENNLEVINYLKVANNEKKVSLATNWMFNPS